MDDDQVIAQGGFHPDYEEEKKYFKECKIYSMQIESTLTCPQGCLYCYAAFDNDQTKELPRNDVISVINSAVNMEVRAIDWLGGDPLLRSDWYELMQYAQDKGLTNNIWTSGIPLENEEVAKDAVAVSEGGFISVHLDTLDEDIYQKLHKGNPKRKIEAILTGVDNVQRFGKKPLHMINCITFTKVIAQDVKRTIQVFSQEKGMKTCLTQMCLTGSAEDRQDWVPSMEEIWNACKIRDKINYPESNLSMSSMDTNKFYCGGVICVTIDGDVTPCSVIRKGFGNIHEASIEQIVEKHKDDLLMTHLRDTRNLPKDCMNCENNVVCWGCRAAAFYEHGDMFAKDPKCYKTKII